MSVAVLGEKSQPHPATIQTATVILIVDHLPDRFVYVVTLSGRAKCFIDRSLTDLKI
jgi:hypothetical protein